MQFYSIWPYFVGMTAILVLAGSPVAATAEGWQNAGKRRSNIDGLRGFLAFGVVFHHAAVYHQYLLDGRWGPPPSRFFAALGPVSVGLFFLITAYLFWGRLIDKRGSPNWTELYVGRIFRLFPLYLFAIGVMTSLVFLRTGFSLAVPLRDLLTEILRWSLGGMVAGGDINNYPRTSLVIAGVTWSLWFEWRYYAALLPLSLAARYGRTHLWFSLGGAVFSLAYLVLHRDPNRASAWICFAALFFLGMLCASLERQRLMIKLPNWFGSLAILVALSVCVTSSPNIPYSARLVLGLGLVFYLIVAGSDLFGLLSRRNAIVVGDMSYSVYLLHGLIYSIVFSFKPVAAFSLAAPVQHWAIIFACVIMTLLVSSATHARIELVGVAYGKQVSNAIDSLLARRRRRAVPL
jgi:peptidoglycan/LPS O-acetylase OafA/YrhL